MGKKKKSSFYIKGGYFSLDRRVYRSEQFSRLSCMQKLVLFHLICYWVPNKSECIAMSSRRLASELRINKDTAAKALRALEQRSFIKVVDESSWFYGKSRSYRTTFKPHNRQPATNDWEKQQVDGPDISDHLSDGTGHWGSKNPEMKLKSPAG